ncbi:MAG: MarR family transcriptional regulator [Actinomycetota bacterium]
MKPTPSADLAARLRQAVTRVNRRLRVTSLGEISPAQASMLASVEILDAPTLGDLAAAEQIQPPSVTRLVKGLAEAGYLVQKTDANDRRSTRVGITPRGKKALTEIRDRKTQFLNSKLSALSAKELQKAQELVTLLEGLLEE